MRRELTRPTPIGRLPSGANGKPHAPSRAATRRGRRRVTWRPGQHPATEEERILHDALTQQGLHWFDDVKAHLADTLYWRDFLRAGLVWDMALLRRHYHREALDIIEKLNGTALTIEEA
jgi:hypothetical protein